MAFGEVKHLHHITPKHFGGRNEPSNLIKLTISEHAAWHYELWVYYGKKEDYIAWQGLSHTINKEQMWIESCKLGGINCNGKNGKYIRDNKLGIFSFSDEKKQKLRIKAANCAKEVLTGGPKTEKHKLAMKGSRAHVNQTGSKNNNAKSINTPYGTFNSMRDASEQLNMKYDSIWWKLNHNKENWSYV